MASKRYNGQYCPSSTSAEEAPFVSSNVSEASISLPRQNSKRKRGWEGSVVNVAVAGVVFFVLSLLTIHRLLDSYESAAAIPVYRHSEFAEDVGDHSRAYTTLREEYDDLLPFDSAADVERVAAAVESLHTNSYRTTLSEEQYAIDNCPHTPPPNYPHAWPVLEVLDHWPPDTILPPDPQTIYQSICRFDYQTDIDKITNYRKAEVPYVVHNDPRVGRTVERWNMDGYLEKLLRNVKYRAEYSHDNHFMYWRSPRRRDKNVQWDPPTKMIRMTFAEWKTHALAASAADVPNTPHWYFRLIGCGRMGKNCDTTSSEYLFDELPFYQPKRDNDIYLTDWNRQMGIHCRFGMKGVIAENHFDGSRNSIVVLGGERRYILTHPNQCDYLALLPKGHPSARHSAVDWSNPDVNAYPQFKNAKVNEVVLQAGDVLYLPTYWFHYIISLDTNYQCNTRSGISNEYSDPIHACGF